MDLFAKTLRVDACPEEITKQCAKLLEWLPKYPQAAFGYTDVHTLLKCYVFIHEISRSTDTNVLNTLVAYEPFFKKYYKLLIDICGDREMIFSLCYNIQRTPNTLRNAVLLDHVFKSLKNVYPGICEQILNVKQYNVHEVKYQKLDLLVNRLFQIPFKQIDSALETLCSRIEFEIIGLLFCAEICNLSSAKYAILEYKLCEKLKSTNLNACKYFIKSIIIYIVKNNDNLMLYKECLNNKYFWDALCIFFNNFLNNSLTNSNPNDIIRNSEIYYLIKTTMDFKCPDFSKSNFNPVFIKILTQLSALFS